MWAGSRRLGTDPGVDLSKTFHPGGGLGRRHAGADPGRQLPGAAGSQPAPLQPVLRNNFWLVTHVMTITLSYAAFALALGIADITLGYYLFGSRNFDAIDALSRFTYRTLAGRRRPLGGRHGDLGAVWADYSWGRFWGWDPKEVWALITLIVYWAVLHARFAGWVGNFGLAASRWLASRWSSWPGTA